MSINLQKGQRIDLTKENNSLNNIMVGLGWDEAGHENPDKGFLARFFSEKKPEIDCDAAAVICDKTGKYIQLVYYSNLQSYDGSVIHQGDNLTGAGEGDCEQILVNLARVDSEVGKIVFVANIYEASSRDQHFGMIHNAYIHLVDMDKNNEICRFNLSENYSGMEGLIVGEIYRSENGWKFNAIGQAVPKASRLDKIIAMYE